MQAIAELRGWSPLIALQIEYSFIERTVERELIPMASEMGLGVIPWSPLASGVLAGKYTRAPAIGQGLGGRGWHAQRYRRFERLPHRARPCHRRHRR
jgi:aryl-alcohol dehydrogenase-like predicted oxidoreductase